MWDDEDAAPRVAPDEQRGHVAPSRSGGFDGSRSMDGAPYRESPSSFAQRGMWLAEQISPATPMHTVVNAYTIRGSLDVDAMRRSFQLIIDRHEVLRTGLALSTDDVVQRVAQCATVPLPVVDLSGLPPKERERRTGQLIRQAGRAVLDLAAGDVFRVALVRQHATRHVLLMTVHHIAFDAWSQGIFLRELSACYDAFASGGRPRLGELPLQYAEFSVAQRRQVTGRLRSGVSYWHRQLAGMPDTELPPLGSRPAVPGWRSKRLSVALPPRASARLLQLSRQNRASPFMTLLTAFQVLLSRYTGAFDLSVATAVSGRTASELEQLIGPFVNTLILRGDLRGDPRFVDLLARTRSAVLDAYAHEETPFERVVDELGAAGTLGRNPFTQVFFVMLEGDAEPVALPGLEVEQAPVSGNIIRTDLRLGIELGRTGACATWDYRTDLYDAAYIASLSDCFLTLLEGIAANPDARVGDLPLLVGGRRERVIAMGAGAALNTPSQTLHGRFTRQAAATPAVPAVVASDAILSYEQLDLAAEGLAARLRQAGCGIGDRVAVAIDRCAAMAVAVLGTFKAGACYVPVDPELPARRWSALIAEAEPVAFLVNEPAPVGIDPGGAELVTVDVAALCSAAAQAQAPVPPPGSGDRIAYVLYTSGTSGVPKGVAVTHQQILSYLAGVDEVAGLPAARYGMVQPLAVDASVTMLFGAWYRGGTLYPIARETGLDATALAKHIQQHQLDILKIAPTHLQTLQQVVPAADLMPARWLMIGGEGSSSAWARSLTTARAGCTVYNHYGPTETTVGVLMHELTHDDGGAMTPSRTLLGAPLSGTRLYVLDPAGEPLPPMVTGELCIGGALVALGYHSRAAMTAERFVPDRFNALEGSRLYRSGDRGRLRPDGLFEFLGREDDQVKIRGYRVELGEIEAVLREHPAVHQVTVRATGGNGGTTIVAFVALRPTGQGKPPADSVYDELCAHAAQRLPSHMVPAAVMALDDLPLSAHGKLDARALPAARSAAGAGSALPASPTEEAIITVWRDLLGVGEIGRHDDFFRLGGHSLLATLAAARLTSALGSTVTVAALFRHRTPAGLGEHLRRSEIQVNDPVLVSLGPEPGTSTAPVICLHPISGTVACYTELAQALTGRHVLGVQAPRRTGAEPPESVFAITGAYLAAIRERWPTGPLVLVGWSMGGLLAYELAQQLAAAGDPPRLTIVLDTVLTEAPSGELDEPAIAAALARFMAAGLGASQQPPGEAELARLDHPSRMKAIQQWLTASGTAEAGVDLVERYEVFRANLRAQRRYQPGPSVVPLMLASAAETPVPVERWRRLTGGRLTVRQFPGDHYSLLREPTVSQLAAWMKDHIDGARGRDGR